MTGNEIFIGVRGSNFLNTFWSLLILLFSFYSMINKIAIRIPSDSDFVYHKLMILFIHHGIYGTRAQGDITDKA